jgi:small-conductance mechanosensitive channel
MQAADIFSRPYLGNTVLAYAIALGIFVALAGLTLFLRRVGPVSRAVHRRVAAGTASNTDRFLAVQIDRTFAPAFLAFSAFVAVSTLHLAPAARHTAQLIGEAVVAWLVARLAVGFVELAVEQQIAHNEKRGLAAINLRAFLPFAQVLVWGLAIVFILDDWGFHVSAIIEGLGIGGAAVALAAQSLLKDWFGYVALVSDRPFEIGHVVQISADYTGTIVSIGIRSTRIRSISGEELTIPNSDLAAARLRNFTRMRERRVVFHFTIAPATPSSLVRRVPDLVRDAVEAQTLVRFERSTWSTFASTGYEFENVYVVLTGDDDVRMDRQHEINLDLLDALASAGIALADGAAPAAVATTRETAPKAETPRAPTESEKNRAATIP